MLQRRDDLNEKAENNSNINETHESMHNIRSHKETVECIVAIGTSTGGPRALQEVIPMFPADIPAAVLIVQHMPSGFTKSLAERLDSMSRIKVKEAENGDILTKGCAYIAPGGYQMIIDKQSDKFFRIRLTDDEPVGGHKPSVNVLFNSISCLDIKKVIAVVMTGMGKDGLEGSKFIKQLGGKVVAESQESAVVWGMPGEVVKSGLADAIDHLEVLPYRVEEIIKWWK